MLLINTESIDLEDISSLSPQDPQGNKKKKNKRSHENDQATGIDSAEARKRKRKYRDNDQEEPVIQESQSVVDKPLEQDASPRPKKRKKSKGKAPAFPTDAEIEASSHASAAALLSAIVAASVPNAEPSTSVHYDTRAIPQPHQPFAPYPYPFNVSPAFHCDPNSTQVPSIFPSGNLQGAAFSHLAFGSNEDVLRALQDLDITKIASALKTLGEAAAATNAPNFVSPLSVVPSELQPPPPAVGQVPATSNVILGIHPKQPSTSGNKNLLNLSLFGNEQHANPDHAYLLANKWLNATKLAELVRDEGLIYKKGKFSAIEEQQLKSAVERYQNERQLDENQLLELIFAKNEKSRDNAFWSELTAAVPLRPIVAVYHHIRRSHHPLKLQGQWKEHEDDLLRQAVADLGQQWEKVSFRVGRMASDCRDRYRNHIINREIRVSGHWSKEEEDKLTAIVTDMTVSQGKDTDNDVFWGKVSELMGGKRGRQQCRIKWTDALSKTVKNEGQKPRWSPQDGYILVHKIDSLNVRDDTEIDWKTIPDADWNLWSAHTLQRRWFTLKRSVKGYETMTHQEIMDILRIKKAHLPSPPATSTRKRKERKVTSAAAIRDNDGCMASTATAEAGSSTGAGTLNHANVAETAKGDDGEVTSSEDD